MSLTEALYIVHTSQLKPAQLVWYVWYRTLGVKLTQACHCSGCCCGAGSAGCTGLFPPLTARQPVLSALLVWLHGLVSFNRLVGLVVKASASRAEDPGFESRLCRDFFGVESYQ